MAKIKAGTLLRKIQKQNKSGVVKSSENSRFNFNISGDNSRIQIFKKREIVKPYLHPIDHRIIKEQVERSVIKKFEREDPNLTENLGKFLPSHLIADIYSLYYNSVDRLKFEGLDKTNKIKFDIVDSINNSLIKIVTNNSHIGSYVYTEEISKFLYKKFMTLPEDQQKQLQKSLDNCNQSSGNGQKDKNNQEGEGNSDSNDTSTNSGKNKPQQNDQKNKNSQNEDQEDNKNNAPPDSSEQGPQVNSNGNSQKKPDPTQKDVDKMVDNISKMLNSKESKKELEKAFKNAEEKLDKLKEIGVDFENSEDKSDDEKTEIIKNLNNLDNIRKQLKDLNVSKDKVLKAVEKILNGTTNYFSKKCITNDVELFEAEQLLDINGLELLHPAFMKSRIFDMNITERRYIGKFDLYVDCSGSMGSGCGGDLNSISRIVLAKSLAMQMKELGILGDLYEYEDSVKRINNTDISILMMDARGITNIENVLKNILKTGNNSVILTDGESSVYSYTHKALFIGVGTDFGYFSNDKNIGRKFIDTQQCIMYNGKEFVVTDGSQKLSRGW